MKRTLKTLAGVIAVLGLAWLIYFVSSKHEEMNCIGLVININYPEKDVFIEKSEVEQIVKGVYYKNIYSANIRDISTEKLENLLSQNPYVHSANVYANIQGELIINITQRQPIFRVEMAKGSFYVDNYGAFMPLSPQYVSRLVVVSGHIENIDINKIKRINLENESKNPELASVFKMVKFIKKDPFFNALIEQIYLNRNNEIELTPKLGRQSILFGTVDNMGEKVQ